MKLAWIAGALIFGLLALPAIAAAQPAPPVNVRAADTPNDGGHGIDVRWDVPGEAEAASVTAYEVLRATNPQGPWQKVADVTAGLGEFDDRRKIEAGKVVHDVVNGVPYYYLVRAIGPGGSAESVTREAASAKPQLYNTGKTAILVVLLMYSALVIYFVRKARNRAEDIYVRPIAGMDAVDEAVGRATEMGRPILYVLGMGTAAEISTIASYAILARVAKKVAQYQTRLIIPNSDPIVMAVAQETVRQSYIDAGRPDLYNDNDIFFVTQAQFAFVAAVNGIMLRERTATNFYLGKFYAESLILAETGNLAGSIQIAGTDEASQLPFFVTACDYTLIGEELYAASAYLAREPLLLGALKAQDLLKGIAMVWLLIGAILVSLNSSWSWLRALISVQE